MRVSVRTRRRRKLRLTVQGREADEGDDVKHRDDCVATICEPPRILQHWISEWGHITGSTRLVLLRAALSEELGVVEVNLDRHHAQGPLRLRFRVVSDASRSAH